MPEQRGAALVQTIIPFTEIDPQNVGNSDYVCLSQILCTSLLLCSLHQKASSTASSSALTVEAHDPEEAPDYLVTTFAASKKAELSDEVTWQFLARGSEKMLRKRLFQRDGNCVFTGFPEQWKAAHLVRKTNPNWASPDFDELLMYK